MLKVRENIQKLLPKLTPEELESVLVKLSDDIGVTGEEDLRLVKPQDLSSVLKPIQYRTLIEAWEQTKSHAPEVEVVAVSNPSCSLTPNLSTPYSSTANLSTTNNLTCNSSDWLENYVIPWDKMGGELMTALREKRRPDPKELREFVDIVSKSIHPICKKPGKAKLTVIAKQANKAYPASFCDVLCGDKVAGGYESLLRSLINKFDNINRTNVFNVTKKNVNAALSSENVDDPPKRKVIMADQYGCVNWQPTTLPEGESITTQDEKKNRMIQMFNISGSKAVLDTEALNCLKLTYYSQRVDINSLKRINSLLGLWPLLFTDLGLLNHFQMLVGVDLKEKMKKNMKTKGEKILAFFKDSENKKIKQIFKDCSNADSRNSYMVVLFLMMEHFAEKRQTLFKTVECSVTPKDLESISNLPATPCLIICGDDINAATFMLSIDKKCVNEDIPTFNDGLLLLFAVFYNFNIQYTEGAECTLELIQRCFLGINPDKGTKANKKKKTIFNTRVLSFIEKLMYFEWCE